MRGLRAVIRREFVERVRSRWFVLATVGAPLVLMGLMVLPVLMAPPAERGRPRIVVVDRTGLLYDRLAGQLEEGGLEVERHEGGDPAAGTPPGGGLEDLRDRVREGGIYGFLVLDDETLTRGAARFVAGESPAPLRRLSIQGAVVQAALTALLGEEGGTAEALLAGGDLQVEVLSAGVADADLDEPEYLSVFLGTFLLYMVVLLYAVAVMRSTLEEKNSRIVEVVISSIRPWHLMLGKILGVGAVGLLQVGVWAGILLLGGILGLPALVAARPELAELAGAGQHLPGLGYAGLFVVFFLGGYFIFSAMFAAVGAAVNSDQEAQQAQFPLVLLLAGPLMVFPVVMRDPDSALATGLSLVPFFSPVLMFARAGLGAAPAWQIALSVLLMAATVVAVAWVAGRIYKAGILMSGKRPTLAEVVRWVREA